MNASTFEIKRRVSRLSPEEEEALVSLVADLIVNYVKGNTDVSGKHAEGFDRPLRTSGSRGVPPQGEEGVNP